jgi:replicative DNA helicase
MGEKKMSEYTRITFGLNDRGTLVKRGYEYDFAKNRIKTGDVYTSLFNYTDKHNEIMHTSGTVSGITDVTTKKLAFDLDCAGDVNKAKVQTLELVERLQKEGFSEGDIQIYFSGKKGFAVVIDTDTDMTPKEVKNICSNIAVGLDTLDKQIYNASRIFRLPLSKHNDTGLYKIPLAIEQLKDWSVDEIKELAKTPMSPADIKDVWGCAEMPKQLLEMKDKTPKTEVVMSEITFNPEDIDWSKKPKELSAVTWLLEQGMFEAGERNKALLILASRYRYLNFDKNKTYYLLKSAADKQSLRTGQDRKDKKELWGIVNQVFSDNWQGGTFSDKEEPILMRLASIVPKDLHSKTNEDYVKTAASSVKSFKNYAMSIKSNTIKTGLAALDEMIQFQAGRLYAILAAAGVGKTTVSLQILNYVSKHLKIHNMFCSYDMGEPDVLEKLAMKHFRISKKELYKRVEEDQSFMDKFSDLLTENYPNTHFVFKTGQSIDELKHTILETEKRTGTKIKMLIVDYLELIQSKFSDPTQASMEAIQGLREIAINMNICVIVLLQPSKAGTSINEPVTSYTMAKGSSSVAQSVTAMLTLHRPGYSSRTPENDLYMGIDCVKNRSGSLFSLDFYFDGRYSEIRELQAIEKINLEDLRKSLEENKKKKDEW